MKAGGYWILAVMALMALLQPGTWAMLPTPVQAATPTPLVAGSLATAIIADHNHTDLGEIPAAWRESAKSTLKIWYGHTSHGSQITTGMQNLQSEYGATYNFNADGTGGALSYREVSGDLGQGGDLGWRDTTRSQLDRPDNDRNMVIWSWCGGASTSTEPGIGIYLAAMNQLEIDYPGVTFVYMTGHLDGSGVAGNLNLRNNQIRSYCRDNNKVLFDFADIESYDPDGDYFLDRNANDICDYNGGNWAQQWCAANPASVLCGACACAHSQALNCNLKARAFWWMLARVAGGTLPAITNASGATGITSTNATLNGNLISNGGADTTVYIYWGDNNGGTGTWDTNVNLGVLPAGPFSTSLTNLTAGTTYYYRCFATNPGGTSWAAASSPFTTVSVLTVTSPNGGETWGTGSSRNITWTSSGVTAANVKIELSRNSGSSWASIIASTPNDGSQAWTVTAPVTATALIKVISVSNPALFDSSNAVFTIAAPPAAPTLATPAAGAVIPTRTPTLDWNDSAGASSYGVQVAAASTFATPLVSQTGLGASTFTVPGSAGLAWNTTYYWRANAASAAGNSAWSASRTFKTALGPPPDAPYGLTATTMSATRIDLAWTDNSTIENGFKIERKKAGTTTYALAATVGPGVTTYSNTVGLTANTRYFYRVRAYNFTSNYSPYSNEADNTTWPLPPAAPTLMAPATGSVQSTLTPTLDWNEPVNAVSYGVQVASASTFAPGTLRVDLTGQPSTYTVLLSDNLAWGTTYYWRANATDIHGGASRWSAMRTFKTGPGPAPEAPYGLVATPVSSSQINLAWTDNSTIESGFKIERKKAGATTYALAATVGSGVTAYSNITGLTANTQYFYRVRAYNFTSNYSAYCAENSTTTGPLAPTLLSPANNAINQGLTPTLDWNNSIGAVSYGVQVSTDPAFASKAVDEAGLLTSGYAVPGATLSANTLYYWRTYAVNSPGSISAWSLVRNFRTAP